MASMQVRGVCCIWAGQGAVERVPAFGRGWRPRFGDTRAGSGSARVACFPSAQGVGGGVRGGERRWGGAVFVGRSGHQPAGKLGDKGGLGEKGRSLVLAASESAPCTHTHTRPLPVCCPPVPGLLLPPLSLARRKQLRPRLLPGQGRRGAECGGAEKASPEKAAGCGRRLAASAPASHAGPPRLLGPVSLFFPLTLNPVPVGILSFHQPRHSRGHYFSSPVSPLKAAPSPLPDGRSPESQVLSPLKPFGIARPLFCFPLQGPTLAVAIRLYISLPLFADL